jgi:hypothetical protein
MIVAACLAVLQLFATPSFSMIRTMTLDELVSNSDYVVIGELRRIEVEATESPRSDGMQDVSNEVLVTESLKGAWPSDRSMVFRTIKTRHWVEDRVEFPPVGTRMLLFVKKAESGRLQLTNRVQGLWPLQGDKPSRMGTGKTIAEIRSIIAQHSRRKD